MPSLPTLRLWVWLILAATTIGTAINYLVFGFTPGIGLTIFFLLLTAAYLITAALTKTKLPASTYGISVGIFFFAGMISVRSNPLLTFWNIILCFFLVFLLTRSTGMMRFGTFQLPHYLRTLGMPLLYLRNAYTGIKTFTSNLSSIKEHKKSSEITRGLLIALPLLVVFFALFASGDEAFAYFIRKYFVFDFTFSGELIEQIILFVLFALGGFGALFGSFFGAKSEITPSASSEVTNLEKGLTPLEVTVILGLITGLFTLFHFTQISYFFSSAQELREAGVTFANYARKGFFELNTVTVLSLFVLYMIQSHRQQDYTSYKRFTVLSGIIVAQLYLILASSFYRLALYEQQFGFTIMRIFSHAFVLYLAVLITGFFIAVFTHRSLARFASVTFVASLGYFIFMNVVNPEAIIVKQNIERSIKQDKIMSTDFTYLFSELSADAIPTYMHYHEQLKTKLYPDDLGAINYRLKQYRTSDMPGAESNWQEWHLARYRAAKALR